MGKIGGTWRTKIALAAALVALGDWLYFQCGWAGGVFGIYGLAIVLAILAAHPALRRRRSALVALALTATYAVAMVIAPSALAWLLFWAAAVIAVLLPKTAQFDDGWRWFQRLIGHLIHSLAGPLIEWHRVRRLRSRRSNGPRRAILPLVLLPLLGSTVFIWLFAAANPVLQNWLSSLDGFTIDAHSVARFVLWLVLLWLSWAVLRPRLVAPLLDVFEGRGDLAIPGVSTGSVVLSLFAFNAIFLVQNAMDAAWLWGIAPLPPGMTLAGYAHRGAYPLVLTALLAALFVLIALRPGSRTARLPLVRRLVGAWIAQNLFLVFNAALRTIDYVAAYSLTELRIAALAWMALVAVGLVLVLWRMLAEKSSPWLVNANLAAAGVLLTVMCFVDLGATSAWWNVRHAREVDGTGARLDLCYLSELGHSALLPLIELERRPLQPQLRGQVVRIRTAIQHNLDQNLAYGQWSWLSARRAAQARALTGPVPERAVRRYEMTCDGRPHPPPPPPVAAPAPLPPVPAATLTQAVEP